MLAWAVWDTGSAGVSAVVVTFVFSVYLTGTVGKDLPGSVPPASWLGRSLAIAGLTIAVLAPVIGVWVEDPRRRRVTLTVLTGLVVGLVSAMSLIRDRPEYLFPGLALLAIGAACGDLASVPYNAMLRQLTTPQNSGRISGFGLAAAFVGSVGLLLLVYFGCIDGKGPTRGFLQLPVGDGMNVRIAMLLAAGWLAVLATPLLLTAHKLPAPAEAVSSTPGRAGRLPQTLAGPGRRMAPRPQPGLLPVGRGGFSGRSGRRIHLRRRAGRQRIRDLAADVLIFGVAASVVAALGAVFGGFLDDRIGSKPVIIGSLASIIAAGLAMMALSGPRAFWITGLLLCLFIGPAQASARTLLLRMSSAGKEGVAFGLYTMTGRAVSFVAPWLFSVFVDLFGAVRAGMGGLCLVMVGGLLGLLMVRVPQRVPAADVG